MNDRGLLLGVDGGQTSTKSLLVTPDGEVLARGTGGPSDHFHIEGGIKKNRIALHGAIESALSAANVSAVDVQSVSLGLTGALPIGDQNPIVQQIVREVVAHLANDRIAVLPDYKTNLLGASGGEPGVVLIAGGGCIAYGITVDGREGIAGGYGYLLGDQGSAFDIGLRAIDAATKADDLRGERTRLLGVVINHFGLREIREITQVVYRAGFSREQISLLTPKVVAAAETGDFAAAELVVDAANDAAETALGVVRQLYAPGDAVTVYVTGGVFRAGELVHDPFQVALQVGWPQATPTSPRFPPVVGAIIVAARAAGIAVDETWLSNLDASMRSAESGWA